MPQDLADLRAALDRLGQLVDALKATTDPGLPLAPEVRGRLLEGLLGDCGRAWGEVERMGALEEARLREALKERTINDMNTVQAAQATRRRGRPLKSKHPFPRALDDKGSSVAEWAEKNHLPREVAKSWYAPPPGGRRIPEKWAKLIEKELGVPATARTWRNGIR